MRERILKFIETENIAPAKFADEIGVQRSSISHILSGRNNPSFDFIQKILSRYKTLNAEWLVMGTGPMYKSMEQGSLFNNPIQEPDIFNQPVETKKILQPNTDNLKSEAAIVPNSIPKEEASNKNKIEKVLFFYTDKSFSIYFPES